MELSDHVKECGAALRRESEQQIIPLFIIQNSSPRIRPQCDYAVERNNITYCIGKKEDCINMNGQRQGSIGYVCLNPTGYIPNLMKPRARPLIRAYLN